MKKKLLIIILVLLMLAGITAIAVIHADGEAVTQFSFTEEIVVKEGVAENKETIIPFSLTEDGNYVIYADWNAKKAGIITGLAVRNEADEILFLVTGESVESESIELELAAGEYKAQFVFITSDEVLGQFLEEADGTKFTEEYTYAADENYEIVYHVKLMEAGAKEYNIGFIIGAAVGVLGGLCLVILIRKYVKKDKKSSCKYDERQLQARGDGFKYGFATSILYNGVLCMMSLMGIAVPAEQSVVLMIGVLLSIFVWAFYCIRKEAYVSLNENIARIKGIFIVIGLVNIGIGLLHAIQGTLIQNGILTFRGINLLCGILLLTLVIVLSVHGKAEEADEDEMEA